MLSVSVDAVDDVRLNGLHPIRLIGCRAEIHEVPGFTWSAAVVWERVGRVEEAIARGVRQEKPRIIPVEAPHRMAAWIVVPVNAVEGQLGIAVLKIAILRSHLVAVALHFALACLYS